MELNREVVVRIAEASIIETIEAFVRFRPGFTATQAFATISIIG